MPIECTLLANQPVPVLTCQKCGIQPFVPFLRGQIQRPKRRWWGLGAPQDYCALICSNCHEIVGYESPPELIPPP